jgi:hypothetical protein
MECAIGVEPMNSTLCRREPWPFGYAHVERKKLPGMDSNHHVACFRGRWATDYPHQARRIGEGGFLRKLRPRGSKPLTLTRLRYSPKMVATSATGTVRAATRE